MSTSYHYANLTKQEWFSASAFGGSGNWRGLGWNLTAQAFELLLIRGSRKSNPTDRIELGRWAGDSIAIIGDSDDDWCGYFERFADLYVDLIPFLYRNVGFEVLGEAATADDRLYVQICHMIVTRQAIKWEHGMRERFGANFLRRYKELYPKLLPFAQPRDLRWPLGNT